MLIDCPKCNHSTLDQCTINHIICLNEDCNASYKLERKRDKSIKSWRESGEKVQSKEQNFAKELAQLEAKNDNTLNIYANL